MKTKSWIVWATETKNWNSHPTETSRLEGKIHLEAKSVSFPPISKRPSYNLVSTSIRRAMSENNSRVNRNDSVRLQAWSQGLPEAKNLIKHSERTTSHQLIARITWISVGMVSTQYWCTISRLAIRWAGPYAQPVFHPVTENVLPAEPIVMVRSHMPGSVHMRMCSLSS